MHFKLSRSLQQNRRRPGGSGCHTATSAAQHALPASSGDKGKKRCVQLYPICLCMERTDSFVLVIRPAAQPPCYVRRKHQPVFQVCRVLFLLLAPFRRAKVGVDGVYSKLFDGLVISIHLATGLSTRAT